MSNVCFHRLLIITGAAISSSAAFGQIDIQLHARQMPGWTPALARVVARSVSGWITAQKCACAAT
jgi:hypothetical protein